MINRILSLFRPAQPRPEPVVDMADLIIATRALRIHNRNQRGAAIYRRVHTIMKDGLREHHQRAFEKLSEAWK